MNNVGTYVDPKLLIDKIPNGLKIKGLRDALVKILQDYRVQISLLEGSLQIMTKDCLTLMEKQIKYVKKGIRVERKFFRFFFIMRSAGAVVIIDNVQLHPRFHTNILLSKCLDVHSA